MDAVRDVLRHAKAWDASVRRIHTDKSLAKWDATAQAVAARKRYGKSAGFNFPTKPNASAWLQSLRVGSSCQARDSAGNW